MVSILLNERKNLFIPFSWKCEILRQFKHKMCVIHSIERVLWNVLPYKFSFGFEIKTNPHLHIYYGKGTAFAF